MVVRTPCPGLSVPSVTVLQTDCQHAGRVGQPRAEVTRGVFGHAGLRPGMVKVVGRMSIVVVHPRGGGLGGPEQEMGGAQGGGSQTVEV
jgi:hypothetical protein